MKPWWSINYVNIKYKHQSNNNEIKHQWLTSFEDQWTSMKQPYQVHSKFDFLSGRTLLPTGLWFQVDPGFQHFTDAQHMGFAGIGEAGIFDVCISLHWTGNHLRMIGLFSDLWVDRKWMKRWYCCFKKSHQHVSIRISMYHLKWWYPHFTPQNDHFLVGKPMGQLGKPTILGNPHICITNPFTYFTWTNSFSTNHSTESLENRFVQREVLTLCEALLPRKPSKKAGGFLFFCFLKGGTVYHRYIWYHSHTYIHIYMYMYMLCIYVFF